MKYFVRVLNKEATILPKKNDELTETEKIHIEDIIKLCEKNIGNKYLTPNKNIKVLVKKINKNL